MTSDIWKNELNKLMKILAVVTNNTPNSIGGGGIPLQPYAPKLQENITKIDKLTDTEIQIYPNPLKGDYLYLSVNATVEVYTIHGSLVGLYSNTNCIDFRLKKGIYMIKILKDDYRITKKIIKM